MKLNIKHRVLILMTCFIYNFSFAQTPPISSNEMDEQYTPKGTGPLSPTAKSNSSFSGSGSSDYPKNIIKFTPTLLTRSMVVFGYERNFHENISASVGLGFNFNKDRIYSEFGASMRLDERGGIRNELSISDVLEASEHSGVSPYFSIAPKFIYESYFFDGTGFFELAFLHYANKMDFAISPDYSPSDYRIVGSRSLKYNYNMFVLKYGYQMVTEGKLATTHEFFFTMGYRLINYTPVIATELEYTPGSTYRTEYSVLQTKQTTQSVMFGFGY
ncbi:MAG: hypothetical protein JNM51_01705, partial [Bacteroidia bacterium]|nr:hypothetical protein [Bacteroidia bacterium]